jgi:hypothetical protein
MRNLPATAVPTNQAPAVSTNGQLGGLDTNLPPGQPIWTNAAGQVFTNYPGVASLQTHGRPPSVAGPTNTVPAPRSNVTRAQLENISRLEVAFNALELPPRSGSNYQAALIEALQAAPITEVRPPPESITQLGTRLAETVPSLGLTASQRRQLAIDVNMAINSSDQQQQSIDIRGPEGDR